MGHSPWEWPAGSLPDFWSSGQGQRWLKVPMPALGAGPAGWQLPAFSVLPSACQPHRAPAPASSTFPSPRAPVSASWSSSGSSVLLQGNLESVCGPDSVDQVQAFWGVPASPSRPLPVPSLPHTAGCNVNSKPVQSLSARAGWQPTCHLVPAPWICPCQAHLHPLLASPSHSHGL